MITHPLYVSWNVSLGTRTPVVDIRRVRKDWRANVSGDRLVGIRPGGGGDWIRIKIRIVENFAKTRDAATSAMPTPTSNVCGAEG